MVNGMDMETARRYIKVRDRIEEIIDEIYALADMMSLLAELSEDEVRINPRSVACFGMMIAYGVLLINEELDDNFASIADVKLKLAAKENNNI